MKIEAYFIEVKSQTSRLGVRPIDQLLAFNAWQVTVGPQPDLDRTSTS